MQPHSSPPFSSSQVRLGQSAPTQGSSTTPAKKENKQKHNLIFTPTHGSPWSPFGFVTSEDGQGPDANEQTGQPSKK